MNKNSIPEVIQLPGDTQPGKPRRRLIGGREIILVLIAFSLLALAPSIAQVVGVTRSP